MGAPGKGGKGRGRGQGTGRARDAGGGRSGGGAAARASRGGRAPHRAEGGGRGAGTMQQQQQLAEFLIPLTAVTVDESPGGVLGRGALGEVRLSHHCLNLGARGVSLPQVLESVPISFQTL